MQPNPKLNSEHTYQLQRWMHYATHILKHSPKTVEERAYTVQAFMLKAQDIPGDRLLWQLDTFDLEMMLVGLTVNSIRTHRNALLSFYGFLAKARVVESDAAARGIVKHSETKPKPKPISEQALEGALNSIGSNARMGAMLALGAYAGARCIEIGRVHSRDFDWNDPGNFGIWLHGKGRHGEPKSRRVPMHDKVRYYCTHLGVPEDGYLFPSAKGGHLCEGYVSQLIGDYLKACGLKDSAHALRHRFGTKHYRLTRDLYETSRLLGHANVEVTKRYVMVDGPDDHTRAALNVSRL